MKSNFISEYISFLNAAKSIYHVVKESESILSKAGYKKINSIKEIDRNKEGNFYIILNETLLFAFKNKNGNCLRIVATHIDSPVLKIRQNTLKNNNKSFKLSTYGGGLWHTWFDRPLGIAGKFFGKESSLFDTVDPVTYIPSLPPHLDKNGCYKEGFAYNKENNLIGISDISENVELDNQFTDINLEAKTYDLSLYDVQPAIIGGFNKKLVFGPKQDNLLSTFCGLKGLINSENCSGVSVFVAFDHEEVGSETITGAKTALFDELIDKLVDDRHENSFFLSVDVAHALNQNYSDCYDPNNAPILGKGMVLKYSNHYCTNAYTASVISRIAKKNLQIFTLKNDMRGGGTIGPMIATRLGIQGVDIGAPILGMHSIKEASHIDDVNENYSLMISFFQNKELN